MERAINLIGILKDGKAEYFPKLSYTLESGDKLLVIREERS
jgi:K+/H+ antiporter YhaU regulatory subunit KhtT